jgi:thioesterase domain-containing protein/acyl carrier protein
VPIGKPVRNVQVYLLDPQLQPVPVGVPGELHIGGVGVGRGYLGQPGSTAEAFVPHPFSAEPGARLYKTGDLARYLPDGTIEFLGRIDQQVKIRGFRVELGGIEVVLAHHPAVREAAVIVREDIPGDKRLVGYVVPNGAQTGLDGELRNFLKTRLPYYMVPSAFVTLEDLPLTPSGKVDRRALPKPDRVRAVSQEEFTAPRNEIEVRLAQVWEELLDIRPVGVLDNFFELGGHSLLAVSLTAQIEEEFDVNVPLTILFQEPTIERLAEIIAEETGLAAWPTLVDIQPEGSKPPFFCVHPLCGDVVGYATWARYLGPDQPFYGLRAQGLDGVQEPLTQVEAIAADYVEEVRAVQPEGPYYVGGYGGGGIIAYEMAQQLEAQGQEVAMVAILNDAAPNSGYYDVKWGPGFVIDFLGNLPYWLYEFVRLKSAQVVFHIELQLRPSGILGRIERRVRLPKAVISLKERFEERARRLLDEHNRALLDHDNVPRVHDERQRKIAMTHYQALLNYVPQEYPGHVTVFRTNRQPLLCSFDPELCWGKLAAGGVDVRRIPGSTATILRDPYARTLAKELGICLKEAQVRV